MSFDIDKFYDSACKKVDAVPFGYLEYRLSYAPEGYVFCALDKLNGVYVKKQPDGRLRHEDIWGRCVGN